MKDLDESWAKDCDIALQQNVSRYSGTLQNVFSLDYTSFNSRILRHSVDRLRPRALAVSALRQ